MTYKDDLRAHRRNVRRQLEEVFLIATEEVGHSVVEGSAITGAPGQPVDTGELKGSWIERYVDRFIYRLTTDKIYAPFIEGGNYVQRSVVGGPHSVRLTRTGWPRIVEDAARRVGPAEGRHRR